MKVPFSEIIVQELFDDVFRIVSTPTFKPLGKSVPAPVRLDNSSFSSDLLLAVNNELFSDITFCCGDGVSIFGHRILLVCSGCDEITRAIEKNERGDIFVDVREVLCAI